MTNKEAIEIIKTAAVQVKWDYPLDYAAAFDKAVNALKAQEPIKPGNRVKDIPGSIPLWYCGECGFYLGSNDAFCSHCGRAVKWDEA